MIRGSVINIDRSVDQQIGRAEDDIGHIAAALPAFPRLQHGRARTGKDFRGILTVQQHDADPIDMIAVRPMIKCDPSRLGLNGDAVHADVFAFPGDIGTCAALIRRVTGVRARVYRFPGGGHEEKVPLLERAGYRVVRWNAVCGDEEIAGASPERLVRESVRTAGGRKNVVLLLHDSAPHRATARALPAIIAHFRAEGYSFCAF